MTTHPHAPLFDGPLAGFSDALRIRLPADMFIVNGDQLLAGKELDACLERFAAASGCRDRRAAASQWSKYLFSRLIVPITVVQLGCDRAFDLEPARMQIGLNNDATPLAFVLAADSRDEKEREGSNFASLLDDILTPIVARLSEHCRLSPRVFWSNAAVYFDWAVGELTRQGRIPGGRIAAAGALLDARVRPDGGFNPFDRAHKDCKPGALDGNEEPITRCRRLCCMRDLDARWGLCANCPRAVRHGAVPTAVET